MLFFAEQVPLGNASLLLSLWRNDIYNESDFLAREREERPVYEHVVVAAS
jgi:hypothetical protein